MGAIPVIRYLLAGTALWAAAVLGAAPARGEPPLTVAIDLTRLGEEEHRDLAASDLEKAAVVRLVQSGFAVVSAGGRPDIAVVVWGSGRTLVLEAVAGGETRETRLELASEDSATQRVFEFAQRVDHLVREAAGAARAASAGGEEPHGAAVAGAIERPQLPAAAVRERRLDVRLAALATGGGADGPALGVAFTRAWPGTRWSLGGAGAVAWLSAFGADAPEVSAAAVVERRLLADDTLSLSIGVELGLAILGSTGEQGTTVDGVASLPVTLRLVVAGPIVVHSRAALGAGARSTRGPGEGGGRVRGEIGLGMSLGW